jgi:Tfp pilus assembly protein PilN
MRAVNLLPEENTGRRLPKAATVPVAGAAAALVAVGIVGTFAHTEGSKVSSKQRQVEDLKQQLAQLQTPEPTANASGATLLTSRDARVAALNAALASRVSWQTVLRQLARVLPEDTWLDGLTMTSPVSADPTTTTTTSTSTTAAPTAVQITGYTSSPENLARVIQRLSVVPTLSDVTLTNSALVHRGAKTVFQFSISAGIPTPGGAS